MSYIQTQEKPSAKQKWALLLQALRPRQWTKNLIAYAPLLFATKMHEGLLFLDATWCVLSFCLISGALYIFNDVLDAEADRAHPKKRLRPIASGKLDKNTASVFALVVVFIGLAISFLVRPTLTVVCLVYLALGLTYATVLKHHPILDVLAIAAGFVLRAFAGALAVRVPMSGWFLLCTSLAALFLALEKRRQELNLLGDNSTIHRKSLEGYSIELLDRMESIIVPSLLTSYAFYSFLSIHGQWMMLTVPFVLYGVMRYQMLSVEHQITGTPEEVLLKDRPIQLTLILWLLTAACVVYGVPNVLRPISHAVDSLKLFQ
ncbi:MAG: decaprenyl-phosphate phosphoribosyltransferase [Candidatus Melainabacteria bacterium]|nr:decaprenyl-phosphate phosphoribosyltransferase [Candidatus Melainabacteria bacterium]